ncbi:MAG: ketoacyl-ACP synthase III [Lentimicrobiaceae bacterium]|nr:ketoacyl-ACP synthase III [Lentimicrobiaceae bacterium]
MAVFKYRGIGISGMAGAVPKEVYNNYTDNPNFSLEDAKAIVDKTGIFERRIARPETCASDLAYAAATQLFSSGKFEKEHTDALIFVSQTPDYRMPATGILMQARLNLPKSCAAFDVNLGCSGFVYGLNLAYSLASQEGIRNVMLINAETRSKVYSFKDRQTGFLFGDAATAFIISKNSSLGSSVFKLDSDGEKGNYIMAKSGGYRNPSTQDSFIEKQQPDGGFHSDEQGYMDGAGVFEFVITQVPRSIKDTLALAETEREKIDYFVFHQANRFMNDHLIRKLKLEPEKVPYCLHRFGNTSSVSIPLTMVSELSDKLNQTKNLLISGFGVGLSLGSAVIPVHSPEVLPLIEI